MRKDMLKTMTLTLLTLCFSVTVIAAEKSERISNLASDQLRKEHDLTLKMLDAARQEAMQIRRTGKLDAERIGRTHDFFSNFVDRCHHAKEERFYFPAAKFHDGEEIETQTADLVNEHNYARTLLQEVAYQIDRKKEADANLIADRLDRYAEII